MWVFQRCLSIFWSSVLKQGICYMDVVDNELNAKKKKGRKIGGKKAEWMKSGVEEDKRQIKLLFPCYAGIPYYDLYSSGIFSLPHYSYSCFLWVHICCLHFLLFPVIFPIPYLKITTFKFTLVLFHVTLCKFFMNHQFI